MCPIWSLRVRASASTGEPENCAHCGSVAHLSVRCPFVLPGDMPEPGEKCPLCGSLFHQARCCPRRKEGYCTRCKESFLFWPEEHGPNRCAVVAPKCGRCEGTGHISALCPGRAPLLVYLCGVCGSGEHLNATCPHREIHPQAHGFEEDHRAVEEDDVAPDVWAAIAPNLPGYLPPVNPPVGGQGVPGGNQIPAGYNGSFEAPPGFQITDNVYHTEHGARFHLFSDCRGLERATMVLQEPLDELRPAAVRLTCCQFCANRWRDNHPQH